MRKLTLIAAAASALLTGAAVAGSADAQSLYVAPTPAINAVYVPGGQPLLQSVQYFWGGRNYCWYDGWNGPGYYWCGYGSRRGFGWGGGLGWHGWAHGGGGHYHGAAYSVHRGGGGHSFHGGGGHGGGGHGGHSGGGHGGGHGGGEHHH